jgi:hypothetical protein
MNHYPDALENLEELDERASLVEEARAILAGEMPGRRPSRDHVAALLSMLDGSPWPPSPVAYGQRALGLPAGEPLH